MRSADYFEELGSVPDSATNGTTNLIVSAMHIHKWPKKILALHIDTAFLEVLVYYLYWNRATSIFKLWVSCYMCCRLSELLAYAPCLGHWAMHKQLQVLSNWSMALLCMTVNSTKPIISVLISIFGHIESHIIKSNLSSSAHALHVIVFAAAKTYMK